MTREELEHKTARIASTFSEPNGGYKHTNGERNEEAYHLKQDARFKQIMQLIDTYTKAKVLEAIAKGVKLGHRLENDMELKGALATLQAERKKL